MHKLSKVEYVILDLLRSGREMYGLEMVKSADGKLKRGSVYVTLSRMEEKGYVESRQECDAPYAGLPRRLYRIVALGQRAMSAEDAAATAFGGWQGA